MKSPTWWAVFEIQLDPQKKQHEIIFKYKMKDSLFVQSMPPTKQIIIFMSGAVSIWNWVKFKSSIAGFGLPCVSYISLYQGFESKRFEW